MLPCVITCISFCSSANINNTRVILSLGREREREREREIEREREKEREREIERERERKREKEKEKKRQCIQRNFDIRYNVRFLSCHVVHS